MKVFRHLIFLIVFISSTFILTDVKAQLGNPPSPCGTACIACADQCQEPCDPVVCAACINDPQSGCLEGAIPINTNIVLLLFTGIAYGLRVIRIRNLK